MLGHICERFVVKSPISVMVRGTSDRCFHALWRLPGCRHQVPGAYLGLCLLCLAVLSCACSDSSFFLGGTWSPWVPGLILPGGTAPWPLCLCSTGKRSN